MRPLLGEHLASLSRILAEEVAPAVGDDYARQTLDGVVKSLTMLAVRVEEIAPFLDWDNEQTRVLLESLGQHLRLSAPIEGPDDEGPEVMNERLRMVLADAIPALARAGDLAPIHAKVVAHLRERINRFPYTSTASLPSR